VSRGVEALHLFFHHFHQKSVRFIGLWIQAIALLGNPIGQRP
jgi:hypothetical protein